MISKRQRFKKVNNFALYYGVGNEKYLSNYDVAIVEPQGQKQASIKEMQACGSLVIAYVSVMEVFEAFPHYKLLKEEDFLKIGNQPVINKEYNTYLVDLNSKRWKSILIHYIGDLFYNYKYNGIFLDTIGDVEFNIFSEKLQERLIDAAEKLLKEIRSLFEDIILIQNNGLNKLIAKTFPLIDGVCWENPMFKDYSSTTWEGSMVNKLKYLSEKNQLKILLLYEEKQLSKKDLEANLVAKKIAGESKFLLYSTEKYT
jgi:endo-alpha-1,4-polygalactosaminidase (GH114 family)